MGGGVPVVTPMVAGRTGRRMRECAERMRSWMTNWTLGSARRAAMAAASSLAPEAVSMTLMPMGLSLRTMRTPATRARAPASAGMELSR